MTRTRRHLIPILLLLLFVLGPEQLAAANRCAGGGASRPDESGIGGTGLQPGRDADGVGGTGLRPGGEEDDSGVGGTGISARDETGVIGTITGFASICVGGVEIHYDAGSLVSVDDQQATVAELAVGQVVEVVASGGDDELAARRISVEHLVAGPITGVDGERNEIEVIGQTVRLSAETRGAGAAAGDFTPGATVRVSGMRQEDGVVVASRVDAGTTDRAWLSGAVGRAEAGEAEVSGTPVRLAAGGALAAGEQVRVRGHWDGDRLIADGVERLPALPFDGRVGRLEVEGFASAPSAGQLRVGAYVFDVAPAARAALETQAAASQRVRVEAVVDGRRAVIERVGAAPDLPRRPDRPGDAGGARPRGRALDGGGTTGAVRPDAASGSEARERPPRPDRPDRPDRPAGAGVPERPPVVDRPPLVDRPPIPDRPPRVERPYRPDRPRP